MLLNFDELDDTELLSSSDCINMFHFDKLDNMNKLDNTDKFSSGL